MTRNFLLFVLVGLCLSTLCGCAGQECDFHSQCGATFYCQNGGCRQDCQRDIDCRESHYCNEIGQCLEGARPDAGSRADAGSSGLDSGATPGADSGSLDSGGLDSGGLDSGSTPRVDSGPTVGTARYLDRCTGDSGCASGRCISDTGGTSFCSILCTGHRDCASEHVCGGDGVCHHDDTGAGCTTSSAAACELGLCIANSMTGIGHCTRSCSDAGECPAGYACAAAGSSRVCVDIEKPCSGPNSCETGICLSVQGCTAECRSAADCPQRLGILPAYTCERAFGSVNPICVPPADALGPDPIGASCPAVGTVMCRSGACDTSPPAGPMCTQLCTQEGGCAPGLGCRPQVDESSITLLCSRAGARSIGASCSAGSDCDSALCDASGYCSRLCTDDALCPSDMSCMRVPGFSVSLCRR